MGTGVLHKVRFLAGVVGVSTFEDLGTVLSSAAPRKVKGWVCLGVILDGKVLV